MKHFIRQITHYFGFDIIRYHKISEQPFLRSDLSEADRTILQRIAEYTMTSLERQIALVDAVRYLELQRIEGSFVECGVWRGGSSMVSAMTLLQEGRKDRNLYLFDTFEGMTPPTPDDATADGTTAQWHLDRDPKKSGVWAVADIEDVTRNMTSTGYPMDRIHLIKGPVETTIPSQMPKGPIALLRLDTDWYESTRHELLHLFPLLVEGGVMIIDDYGHWTGAKKAVDEYLSQLPKMPYLHRIDYTGRLLIKQ